MAKAPEVDSFGTFLEAVRGESVSHSAVGDSATKVLSILDESGPQDAKELLRRSGIPVTDFAAALKRLVDAELIQLLRTDEIEIVELTEHGRALT